MTYSGEAFERNVEAAKRLSANIAGIRKTFPEFDDRKFAEHLFCLSLNLMNASSPFTTDAAARVKASVDQYFALRDSLGLMVLSLGDVA